MDILLSSFVNKYINSFDENLLSELEKFLNFEDDIILNFYNKNIIDRDLEKNKISLILKTLGFNGGEGGIEPTNELPRCWFSRPVLSTAQPLSLK